MSLELIYTSAPRGLSSAASGFCTVAATGGMSRQVLATLESLSGYQFHFNLSDAKADLNPVNFAHTRVKIGSETRSVLSRIAFAGADYSGRTNKIAHHVLLERGEQTPNGPAWMMLAMARSVFVAEWEAEPRHLDKRSVTAALSSEPRAAEPAKTWEAVTGDAGWAGALAQAFRRSPKVPAYLVYEPGQDLLPLFEEALAILPPEERWQVAFATYYTTLPAGCHYHWRGVLAGSRAAREMRRFPNATVIDLASSLGPAAESPFAEAARTGRVLPSRESAQPSKAKVRIKGRRKRKRPAASVPETVAEETERWSREESVAEEAPAPPQPAQRPPDKVVLAPGGPSPVQLQALIGRARRARWVWPLLAAVIVLAALNLIFVAWSFDIGRLLPSVWFLGSGSSSAEPSSSAEAKPSEKTAQTSEQGSEGQEEPAEAEQQPQPDVNAAGEKDKAASSQSSTPGSKPGEPENGNKVNAPKTVDDPGKPKTDGDKPDEGPGAPKEGPKRIDDIESTQIESSPEVISIRRAHPGEVTPEFEQQPADRKVDGNMLSFQLERGKEFVVVPFPQAVASQFNPPEVEENVFYLRVEHGVGIPCNVLTARIDEDFHFVCEPSENPKIKEQQQCAAFLRWGVIQLADLRQKRLYNCLLGGERLRSEKQGCFAFEADKRTLLKPQPLVFTLKYPWLKGLKLQVAEGKPIPIRVPFHQTIEWEAKLTDKKENQFLFVGEVKVSEEDETVRVEIKFDNRGSIANKARELQSDWRRLRGLIQEHRSSIPNARDEQEKERLKKKLQEKQTDQTALEEKLQVLLDAAVQAVKDKNSIKLLDPWDLPVLKVKLTFPKHLKAEELLSAGQHK